MASCFQGLIPAALFTCAKDGTPNAAFLSHVDYVDPTHVALSFQFFNKSKRNIAENPQALVRLIDPDTSQGWRLQLRFVRSETDRARCSSGWRCASKRSPPIPVSRASSSCSPPISTKCWRWSRSPTSRRWQVATQRRSGASIRCSRCRRCRISRTRIHRADSLERLLDSILEGLETSFGFEHSMILVSDHRRRYATSPLRVAAIRRPALAPRRGSAKASSAWWLKRGNRSVSPGLIRQMLYALAVQKRAHEQGLVAAQRIPLARAAPARQSARRAAARSRRAGWNPLHRKYPARTASTKKTRRRSSCSEATWRSRFKTCSSTSGRPPMLLPSWRVTGACGTDARRRAATAPKPPVKSGRELAYYTGEECILVDGEYLIRSLPAKILWRLLRRRTAEGRAEFTNRELTARQVAQPARMEGQPRDPAAPPAAPARSEMSRHSHRPEGDAGASRSSSGAKWPSSNDLRADGRAFACTFPSWPTQVSPQRSLPICWRDSMTLSE